MRGLKQLTKAQAEYTAEVASFTDAWIETPIRSIVPKRAVSHLLQMRGLKHRDAAVFKLQQESHLLQMRGLKLFEQQWRAFGVYVASFTDAWIETEFKK